MSAVLFAIFSRLATTTSQSVRQKRTKCGMLYNVRCKSRRKTLKAYNFQYLAMYVMTIPQPSNFLALLKSGLLLSSKGSDKKIVVDAEAIREIHVTVSGTRAFLGRIGLFLTKSKTSTKLSQIIQNPICGNGHQNIHREKIIYILHLRTYNNERKSIWLSTGCRISAP